MRAQQGPRRAVAALGAPARLAPALDADGVGSTAAPFQTAAVRGWAGMLVQPWLLVAALALAVRLALAAPAWHDPDRYYVSPDSYEYDQLGMNLVEGHGYSQRPAPPYVPDVRRTPAYPLGLAALYVPAGHRPRLAALAGALLGALAAALTAALGDRLFGRAAGLWAGIILALDLTSAAYSLTLMTETLFTVLLLLALLQAAAYLQRPSGRPALLAGLAVGVAILARPIALFLPLALAPALALLRRPADGRLRWGWPAVVLAVSLCFPVAWTARNYAVAGVAQPTSLIAINAYYQRAALVEARATGAPVDAVRQQLVGQAAGGADEGAGALRGAEGRAIQVILSDPLGYAAVNLEGVARMLGPDRDIVQQLFAGAPASAGLPGSVGAFVTADAHPRPLSGGWLLVAAGQLALDYALALAGLLQGLRRPDQRAAVVLVLVVSAYFLALSGPEAYPRFRVPMMPTVALLAGVAASARRQQLAAVRR